MKPSRVHRPVRPKSDRNIQFYKWLVGFFSLLLN